MWFGLYEVPEMKSFSSHSWYNCVSHFHIFLIYLFLHIYLVSWLDQYCNNINGIIVYIFLTLYNIHCVYNNSYIIHFPLAITINVSVILRDFYPSRFLFFVFHHTVYKPRISFPNPLKFFLYKVLMFLKQQ